MTPPSAPNAVPQFATAEYKSSSGAEVCKSCNQPVAGSYYRVNGSIACEKCATQLRDALPVDTHPLFVRGMIFGAAGAVLGLILYSVFGIVTGLAIGYISLAVGYIVGKAIRMGSRGVGGRRYQIAGVILTYAAVSMSAVPIGIYESIKSHPPRPRPAPSAPASGASQNSTETPTSAPAAESTAAPEKPALGVGKILLTLLFLGLASPFLELKSPINGVLGLVILLVGIRIAWRITSAPQIDILGPFPVSAATPAPTGS